MANTQAIQNASDLALAGMNEQDASVAQANQPTSDVAPTDNQTGGAYSRTPDSRYNDPSMWGADGEIAQAFHVIENNGIDPIEALEAGVRSLQAGGAQSGDEDLTPEINDEDLPDIPEQTEE